MEIVAFNSGLYVLTRTGGVWRSTTASASWDSIGLIGSTDFTRLVAEGNRLYACTRSGNVATSLDGASRSWVGAVGTGNGVCLASWDTPTAI